MIKIKPLWILSGAAVLSGVLWWAQPRSGTDELTANDDISSAVQTLSFDARSAATLEDQTTLLSRYTGVVNQETVIRLKGQAEPNSNLVLETGQGQAISVNVDSKGEWNSQASVGRMDNILISQFTRLSDNSQIQSDDMVLRVVSPGSHLIGESDDTLLAIVSSGGASRIVQSPFTGYARSGPLTFYALDYDDGGGTIFSGRSNVAGRIRIYLGETLFGETGTGRDGSWTVNPTARLPIGTYPITIELAAEGGERFRVRLSFAFDPSENTGLDTGSKNTLDGDTQDDTGANAPRILQAKFEPQYWRISRTLLSGGVQHLVMFSPDANLALDPPTEAILTDSEDSIDGSDSP